MKNGNFCVLISFTSICSIKVDVINFVIGPNSVYDVTRPWIQPITDRVTTLVDLSESSALDFTPSKSSQVPGLEPSADRTWHGMVVVMEMLIMMPVSVIVNNINCFLNIIHIFMKFVTLIYTNNQIVNSWILSWFQNYNAPVNSWVVRSVLVIGHSDSGAFFVVNHNHLNELWSNL